MRLPTAFDHGLQLAVMRGKRLRGDVLGEYDARADLSLVRNFPVSEAFAFEVRDGKVWAFPPDHFADPSWCAAEGCELDAEKGGDFCAFHELQYDDADLVTRGKTIPLREAQTGQRVWDGFGQARGVGNKIQSGYVRIISPVVLPKGMEKPRILRPRVRPLVYAEPVPVPVTFNEVPRYHLTGFNEGTYFAPRGAGGMFNTRGRLDALIEQLRNGAAVREAARVVGCSPGTARRARRFLRIHVEAQGLIFDPRCRCGRKAGHRGWCEPRLEKSPVRQQYIASGRQNENLALSLTRRVAPPQDRQP